MKGTNYLEMIKNALTSAEAEKILIAADTEYKKVEAPIDNEYSDWTDDELSEYLDMLDAVEKYYNEHFEEFHTPREVTELNELVR
jgi:hypothetical protein